MGMYKYSAEGCILQNSNVPGKAIHLFRKGSVRERNLPQRSYQGLGEEATTYQWCTIKMNYISSVPQEEEIMM